MVHVIKSAMAELLVATSVSKSWCTVHAVLVPHGDTWKKQVLLLFLFQQFSLCPINVRISSVNMLLCQNWVILGLLLKIQLNSNGCVNLACSELRVFNKPELTWQKLVYSCRDLKLSWDLRLYSNIQAHYDKLAIHFLLKVPHDVPITT